MGMGTGLVKFRVSTAVPGAQPAPAAGQEGDEGLGGAAWDRTEAAGWEGRRRAQARLEGSAASERSGVGWG